MLFGGTNEDGNSNASSRTRQRVSVAQPLIPDLPLDILLEILDFLVARMSRGQELRSESSFQIATDSHEPLWTLLSSMNLLKRTSIGTISV